MRPNNDVLIKIVPMMSFKYLRIVIDSKDVILEVRNYVLNVLDIINIQQLNQKYNNI